MAAARGAWLIVDGTPVALEVASTARARMRGLLGRDEIKGALLLTPARSVHSLRMRFAVDVAYIDADMAVLAVETLEPNRIGRKVRGTRHVVEAEAGAFERWGLRPGSQLSIPDSEAAV